jgi:hypothetical protein
MCPWPAALFSLCRNVAAQMQMQMHPFGPEPRGVLYHAHGLPRPKRLATSTTAITLLEEP